MSGIGEAMLAIEGLTLAELQEEIDRRNAEIEELLADRRKVVDVLEQLAKLVEIREHGKPRRGRRRKRATPDKEEPEDDAERIRTLLEAAGPMPQSAIARHLELRPNVVARLLNARPKVFTGDGRTWRLVTH